LSPVQAKIGERKMHDESTKEKIETLGKDIYNLRDKLINAKEPDFYLGAAVLISAGWLINEIGNTDGLQFIDGKEVTYLTMPNPLLKMSVAMRIIEDHGFTWTIDCPSSDQYVATLFTSKIQTSHKLPMFSPGAALCLSFVDHKYWSESKL